MSTADSALPDPRIAPMVEAILTHNIAVGDYRHWGAKNPKRAWAEAVTVKGLAAIDALPTDSGIQEGQK